MITKKTTLAAALLLVSGMLLVGCQEKRTFTLNPDGSGKLDVEYVLDTKQADSDFTAMCVAHDVILKNVKGVEAWAGATVERKGDKYILRGTALFPDVNKVDVWGRASPRINPVWTVKSDGSAILELVKASGPSGPGAASKPAKPTESEIAEKIKAMRDKPFVPSFVTEEKFRKIRLEYVFHVPGKVVERTNFAAGEDGSLSVMITGDDLLKADAAIKASDSDMREIVLAGEDKRAGPLANAKFWRELFGKEAGMSAKVELSKQPQFDYAAEVAAARKNYLAMMKKLGLYWTEIPADMPLRFESFTPDRIERAGDKPVKVWFRPELPRSVLKCRGGLVFRMIAEDGSILLPRPGTPQAISPHPEFAAIETKDMPAGAKVIKEVLGAISYTAGDAKELDLGFEEVVPGAKGKLLDAKIVSITTDGEAGKQRTSIVLGVKIPKGMHVHRCNMRGKDRPRMSGPHLLPDGFTGRIFMIDGTLTDKPSFSVTVWENIEELVVPFRLTDVPLTDEGLKAAKAAAKPTE